MNKYRNPWHKADRPYNTCGPAYFETCVTPKTYRGVSIYKISDVQYDAVLCGVCISQCAGPRGIREAIDSFVTGEGNAFRQHTNERVFSLMTYDEQFAIMEALSGEKTA